MQGKEDWRGAMRAFILLLFMAIVSLLATGCQTTCDPRQGGFLTGIYCLSSGGYQDTLDKKDQELRDALETRQRHNQQMARLREELAKIQREREEVERQLVVLESSIKDLHHRVAQGEGLLAADKAELQEIIVKLKALKEEVEVKRKTLKARIASAQAGDQSAEEEMEEVNRLAKKLEFNIKIAEELVGKR
jgi:chromosome segregation ATPase